MYILSYLILSFQTVTSQCNIYCFTHIVMCIQVKQINLKQYECAVDCRKRQGFNRNKVTGEVWHTYVTREMSDICRITSWQQKLIHRWTIHIKINNTVNFTFSKIDYSAGCWPSMNNLGHPALPHGIWLGHSMINRNPHNQEFHLRVKDSPRADFASGSVGHANSQRWQAETCLFW